MKFTLTRELYCVGDIVDANPVTDPVCVAGPEEDVDAGVDDGGEGGEEGTGYYIFISISQFSSTRRYRGMAGGNKKGEIQSPVAANLLYGSSGHSA